MDPLATAKALYAAFIAHNMPGIMALLEDDIEWTSFGPGMALAVGDFKGLKGVADFFAKLIGPEGQQVDTLFKPMLYFVGGGTVHVIGIETGTLTRYIDNGKLTGKPFYNNFDHTLWFGPSGKISRFRANYQLALTPPPSWPPTSGEAA